MRWLPPVTVLLLTLSAALPAAAEDAAIWRMVAQADVVATGRLDPPENLPARDYVVMPVHDVRPLKGDVGAQPAIRWYSEPRSYAPSIEQLRAASGSSSLVFAVRGGDGRLYFAGSPAAHQPAIHATVAAVETEIARQAEVLANWRPSTDFPHFAEVRAIIDDIVALSPASRNERRSGATRQQRLFDRLIALGPTAVPAIIEQMDDDRALPNPAISLVNHAPDAFEAFRQYAPKGMVDALAAVLNQLTGEHFGFIYNGGTAAERDASVRGWRIYLDRLRTGTA